MVTLHRTPFVLGVAAVAALGTLSACSGSQEAASASEEAKPTTLEFVLDAKGGDYDQVGAGEKGDAIGGHHLSAMTLLSDGDVAGRFIVDCLVADPTYEGQMCTGVLIVDGGTLAVQNAGEHKAIPGVDPGPEAFAVTGGTGDYAGARGDMAIGEDDEGPLTITLLP